MTSGNRGGAKAIEAELQLAGFVLKPLHAPRQAIAVTAYPHSCRKSHGSGSGRDYCLAVQVFVPGLRRGCYPGRSGHRPKLAEWLATDSRFTFVPRRHGTFGSWRLHAGAECRNCCRTAFAGGYDRQPYGDERDRPAGSGGRQPGRDRLWRTENLSAHAEAGTDPEKAARLAGGERWIAGNAFRSARIPAPQTKVHLRKGVAGAHDLTIVVRVFRDPSTRSGLRAKDPGAGVAVAEVRNGTAAARTGAQTQSSGSRAPERSQAAAPPTSWCG